MKFYIFDDLKDDLNKSKKDPNAQYVGKWCDAYTVDEKLGDYERCPLCTRAVSTLKWLEPRRIRLTNSKFPDRLTTWLPQSLVLSERFVQAYTKAGLQGIKTFVPLDVVKVSRRSNSGSPTPQYFSAEVDYTLNVRVDELNTIIFGSKYDWSCELCNPWGTSCSQLLKLSLNTENWQGDDIFRVYAVGVIMSQRFCDIVEEHGFTNFNLVPVDQFCRV